MFSPPENSQTPCELSASLSVPLIPRALTSVYDTNNTRAGVLGDRIGATSNYALPAGSASAAIRIRRISRNANYEVLRSMLLFTKGLLDVEFVPNNNPEDANFVTAVAYFQSGQGADEAIGMLHGKPNSNNEATLVVESLSGSGLQAAGLARRNTIDQPSPSSNRMQSNGREVHHAVATAGALATNGASSTGATNTGLPAPDSNSGFNSLFSAQSPIGLGFGDRPRVTGKSVIDEDGDEDTGEIIRDPLAYVGNGFPEPVPAPLPRRATNPNPLRQMGNHLSLATNLPTSPSMQHFPGGTRSAGNPATTPNTNGPSRGRFTGPFHRPNYPPANPADQNPPCNTLYVGNLPPNTSEDELKALFSKQRGYKRMIFRSKEAGPICFVEFEDVSFATKCLNELYGYQLSNSVKGGIRLSFSKNPLGVRNGQPGSMHPHPSHPLPPPITPLSAPPMVNGANMHSNNNNNNQGFPGGSFSTATGPPPGLFAPPWTNEASRAFYHG